MTYRSHSACVCADVRLYFIIIFLKTFPGMLLGFMKLLKFSILVSVDSGDVLLAKKPTRWAIITTQNWCLDLVHRLCLWN